MNLEGIDQNVVLLDSISKRYSACGVRIGVMISKNKEIIGNAMKFAQARLSPPTFGQIAGEEAVNTPESYLTEVLAEYVKRRDIVVESINRMNGCFCPRPGGAFYAVARLPVDDSDRFCQWLLEDFSFENQTVMFAPATGFYSTPGRGKDEVRISYVLNLDDLRNAMKCLEEGLKVYPGRS
jgi:aspartate aminotransferase